jgi:CMP-N-acetylneuraminic acid synthetase
MKANDKTIALIPARGGSKGVPKKNIYNLGGFPLIAYSIIAAKLAKGVDRVIVSTDSSEIAEISKKFGAEVPFLRPAELATDKAIDKDYIKHALRWLADNEGSYPQYLVNLRPTTPLRDPQHIDDAITLIKSKKEATSLRSGHEIKESPYKLFGLSDGFFRGLFPQDPRPEYYDLTRQSFPTGLPRWIIGKTASIALSKSRAIDCMETIQP